MKLKSSYTASIGKEKIEAEDYANLFLVNKIIFKYLWSLIFCHVGKQGD